MVGFGFLWGGDKAIADWTCSVFGKPKKILINHTDVLDEQINR